MSSRSAWLQALTFAALMGLGPLLATSRILEPLTGLVVFLLGGAGCLLLGLSLLVVSGIQRRKDLLLPAFVSILLAAPLPISAAQGGGAPPINDITTDLTDPPTITVEGRPILGKHDLNYPADWVDIVTAGYPGLTGKTLPVSRQEVFIQVETAARANAGWTLHRVDGPSGVIEGSEETGLFHFVDDFSIRVVGTKDGAKVDMRSRSRDGQGDLGKNAERIRGFFSSL